MKYALNAAVPLSHSLMQRDEALVVLVLALPRQEIVIATACLFGKSAASGGAALVDRAVPLRRMEKLASAFEDVVLAMAQDSIPVAFDELGVFSLGLFVTQLETPGQSLDVAFRDQNPIIRAAISRTF